MNKYLAELIGTFALVFCGTGAIVINEQWGHQIDKTLVCITVNLISTLRKPIFFFRK